LLLANGSPEQIDAINSVIDQLLERQHQRGEEESRLEGIRNLAATLEQAGRSDDSQHAQAPDMDHLHGHRPVRDSAFRATVVGRHRSPIG